MRNTKGMLALLLALLLAVLPCAGLSEAADVEVTETLEAEPTEAAPAESAEAEAAAAEPEVSWREGMSPAKPYAGVPEVNLSERMGYMMFYPTDAMPVELCCNTLYVYLPREDVKAGKGKIYLCTEADGAVWSAAMDDSASIHQRAMMSSELNSLLWGSGTCFEVTLPKSLSLGVQYFVNMERGCIVTEDGQIDSPEVGGTEAWTFSVKGDYGLGGLEYRRVVGAEATEDGGAAVTYSESKAIAEVGDEIRFDLTLGGEAVVAVVYGYNDTVDFQTTMFEESGEVTGKVVGANPSWGVMFLDADGNELRRAVFMGGSADESSAE